MSSNFLNTSGAFEGIDTHLFLALNPLTPPIPNPVPYLPHVVAQLHLIGDASKKVSTVTTMALPVFQRGWEMKIVPHIFTLPNPHPTEWINLARIILLSSSAPKLSASTVTGQGSPLLVEEYESVGVNLDCADGWVGLGADLNFNTVKTTPTLGDYANAVFFIALGTLVNRWNGRGSKDDAAAVFNGKHRKGDPMETMSDAVRRQAKSDSRGGVWDLMKKTGVGEATDWAAEQGYISDTVAEVIGTVVG